MKIQKGSIIRRKNGRTPMFVVAAHAGCLDVCYCGKAYNEYPSVMASATETVSYSNIVLVTDPESDFRGCDDWAERLSYEQNVMLSRQMFESRTGYCETPEKEENTMTQLYQTKTEPVEFGTKIGTNSAGKLVIELKGSGAVKLFDKSEVEVVVPHTVTGRNLTTGKSDIPYTIGKGVVALGDLIINPHGQMIRIMAVDTKYSGSCFELTGRRVLTEPIGEQAEVVDELDTE